MAPDWFTLVAQILNFLVLVALLKHFFYDRIISAMDEREAHIAGRLGEAARQRASAEEEAALYRAKNREFEEQREQMLARVAEEAEAHRRQLMEDARRELEKVQAQWLEALERERQALLQDFRHRVGQTAFTLARQGLKELADADLEAQMLKRFEERIRSLDPAQREAIVAAARDSGPDAEIHTAFPLSSATQESLSRALREHLDERIELQFFTDPALICGIELRAHSHRVGWNLDAHLESLEARVFESLDESARKHATT